MPFEHLRYGIDVWRGHFWNNLIGFSHQGRNHVSSTALFLYSPPAACAC